MISYQKKGVQMNIIIDIFYLIALGFETLIELLGIHKLSTASILGLGAASIAACALTPIASTAGLYTLVLVGALGILASLGLKVRGQ